MHTKIISGLLILSVLAPSAAFATSPVAAPFEQDFILTAYYSPLPGQCCYIEGSEYADKVMNGGGTNGADGTQVYPGMLAAPPSYAFGTRISLPGLGMMTVHDRGGAIQVQDHAVRLDVWAGFGEEGLARALAFGVKHIHGVVYPPGSTQPAEKFTLATLTAPVDRLTPYLVADAGLLDMHAAEGETGLSILYLQQTLQKVGYFTAKPDGHFGSSTADALAAFNSDQGLSQTGSYLTAQSAALLMADQELQRSPAPVHYITAKSPKEDIQQAQRLLRWLGYYRGRTDGVYSTNFFMAIAHYQKDRQLIVDTSSPGAGTIGPVTRGALTADWKQRQIVLRANTLLTMKKVGDQLDEEGKLIGDYMQSGQTGSDVKAVQQLLANDGFFPADKVNGVYGVSTKNAVISYQLARGLITSATDRGAGSIGPSTLHQLRSEQIKSGYALVRGMGWDVL